ncbi:AraC family transcriptional regulator [Marinicrinis lubricantis]|uniref:Effector binding domain-containing protein n=1 Tax=Marinicrinis lubricantis TaxID=2086470 RepID=A0ABW1IV22_9BACL
MEWLQRMKDALDYIEGHLEDHIQMGDIAKSAYSSPYHFQRMFYMVTGMTVHEYIRKRRLTLAAQELALARVKVVDVAIKYGYDSPESFSKAFRKAHGISPSAVRQGGVNLKAFPRITFHLSLKGDQEMDYKVVEKQPFTMVGKALKVSMTAEGEHNKEIPKFWSKSHQDGTIDLLISIAADGNVYGVCAEFEEEEDQFTYLIAVTADANSISTEQGLVVKEIPAATWAVFPCIGAMPDAIQKLSMRIFSEWFPSTGYEHAPIPNMEVYPPGDSSSADYRTEVWIPIVKK